jgi:hypothetical protein
MTNCCGLLEDQHFCGCSQGALDFASSSQSAAAASLLLEVTLPHKLTLVSNPQWRYTFRMICYRGATTDEHIECACAVA